VRTVSWVRATGLTLLLFLAIYVPASGAAAALHLPLGVAVPFVIVATALVAAGLTWVLAGRSAAGLIRYGIAASSGRDLAAAALLGLPAALLAAWLLARAQEPGPLEGLSLEPWRIALYFVLAAPAQEELIFRSLLQTTLARIAAAPAPRSARQEVVASILVALLFGGIHLVVGHYTAMAALVLGLLAGELRRRSGSILPAILCHALFNACGLIWA
jgi:membrane protease YdiL (CAAX protease family)